jgi:hypothetical protein
MPTARYTAPLQLAGATAFSQTPEVLDPVWVVKTFRATKWASKPVEDELVIERKTTNPGGWGRKRRPGSWPAMAIAFAVSDSVDLHPWHAATSTELWKAAGFAGKPAYHTVRKRFLELEDGYECFLGAVAALVQHARRHDSCVGRHVHVDGTEAETHAALVHDCSKHFACMTPNPANARGRRSAGEAMRPSRELTDRFRSDRHTAVEKTDDEAPEIDMGDVDEVQTDGSVARFKINGHWFRSLDPTAGIRAYTGPRGATRFWHGFYNQKAVDHYTGAALAVVVESSSRQEYDIYPELYAQLEQTLGARPESMIADKGFSVRRVFQHNTERGIATVITHKRVGGDRRRHDHETHDRHGIPRCKHCGGPSNFVRFSETPKPRVWFDCAIGLTPACAKTQSLSCAKDWKLLVPLWRTNPLYHELKHSHGHYEHTHNNWRSRYRVAADDLGIRPKRRGAGWQRLRAACGLIAEWLRICHRQGWLGSARTNRKHKVERPTDWQKAGEEAAASLAEFRHDVGITAPYGKTAHALDPAWPEKTPSQIFKAKQEKEAAETAAQQAAAVNTKGKRRRKKSDPPPPKPPRRPDPPPPAAIDPNDLPF